MERLTTRHSGVAVIKDKSKIKEAMEKLARYEEDEKGGAYYLGDEDVTALDQDLYVNAWQPLPEGYKEPNYEEENEP